MLTLYHAYHTRATRMLALIHELGIRDQVELVHVDIARQTGEGYADPANPHPEGKVPLLVHDGVEVFESTAITLYLTDMFPEAGFGPAVGDPLRGPYLSWLAYYGDVMEPVYNHFYAGLDHPVLRATFRGVPEVEARITAAFADGRDYLLGSRMSGADLLIQSTYAWFPEAAPKDDKVRAWLARCAARPSTAWALEVDAAQAAKAA